MLFFRTTSHELLRARYNSLLKDVPVAIFMALSALSIQMLVLKDSVDWKLAIAGPAFRMLICAGMLLYWFRHRNEHPPTHAIHRRLDIGSCILIFAGLVTFWRSLYIYPLTDHFGHYYLIFHNTLYGFCFAFILRKIGIAAYLYNLIMISSAIACVFIGHIEHASVVALLIMVFEVGMLLAMRSSSTIFDQWVKATYETQALLKDNQRLANQDVLTQLPNRRQFFCAG